MRRSNAFFLVGLILLVAGAAALVYGIISYNQVTETVGGAFKNLFSGGADKNQAIIWIVAGAAGAVVGLVLLLSGRRRG